MEKVFPLLVFLTFVLDIYFVNSQGVLPEEVIAQEIPREGKKFKTMFGSQSLQCVTCQKMVEEFEWAINQVDPKKKIESGLWDLEGKKKKIITYKRSKEQINDLIDTLCEGQMSDYAQARWKDTKEPTIIRIMSHEGGMNPDFGLVDVIPDEDLNKRLQFYCELIMEKHETHITEVFKEEKPHEDAVIELCETRTKLCSGLKKKLAKDEL